MKPRIAIPVPTSKNPEYNGKSWPMYAEAITRAGGIPVEIPLSLSQREVADLINTCHGVLLPGSPADVNPHKFGHEPAPETSPADPARENVDELLIQDAHNLYKPLLCICFGTQSLNVWRGGTLIQHLSPMPVNHPAGKTVAVAHNAAIAADSLLGQIVGTATNARVPHPSRTGSPASLLAGAGSEGWEEQHPTPEAPLENGFLALPINSSHHQAIGIPGDGLRVVARCPQDGVIEAVEGGQDATNPNAHFVLAVQWHPERSYDISAASRAIFERFVNEAASWKPRAIHTSVAQPANC